MLASAGGIAQRDAARAALIDSVDWGRLTAISLREGAQPVFGRFLRELDSVPVPTDVAASFRHIERTAEFRQRYLERRLMETLEALSNAGIPVMLLKGAAVAHVVFRDFAQRPMSDVDLLVRPEDVPAAHAALLAADWVSRFSHEFDDWYAGMHHLPPLTDRRSPALQVGLDLHTQLFAEERNPFAFDAADMWAGSQEAEGLPRGCTTSRLENHLVHCCLHHAWSHRLAGAGWRTFRDVSAISSHPRFAWPEFLAVVKRTGGATPIYWSLTLARTLAGAAVPDEVLRELRPSRSPAVINLLERHFAHEAVEAERLCPSDRLRREIWVYAMDGGRRIRAAAVPDQRPWERLRHDGSEVARQTGWNRPVLRPAAWAGYFRALVR